MKSLVVLGICVAAGHADADERATTVTVGMLGQVESRDNPDMVPAGTGGPRLTLAWETAPLAYPDHRGYKVGWSLVPELIAGAVLQEARAEGMIGAGLRGELKLAQREQGLLRLSARGAFYLAGRGMVIGKDRDVLGEAVLGEYIYIGAPLRLGFEFGVTSRKHDPMEEAHLGGMFQLYLGWGPR